MFDNHSRFMTVMEKETARNLGMTSYNLMPTNNRVHIIRNIALVNFQQGTCVTVRTVQGHPYRLTRS